MQPGRIAAAIIGANVVLLAVKAYVAFFTGSIAALALLADSLFDLFGSLLAFAGMKKAEQPPDHNHSYGHAKYEALSSAAQLALISVTASAIILEGAHRITSPSPLTLTFIDFALVGGNILVNFGMIKLLSLSTQNGLALKASKGNYQSDIVQNVFVLLGFIAVQNGIGIADSLAAILVAAFMFRVVFTIGRETIIELTDGGPEESQLRSYGQTILSVKEIQSFHKLRARFVGGKVMIDVHVQMNETLSLKKAHALSARVKYALMQKHPEITEVLVHAEPEETHS